MTSVDGNAAAALPAADFDVAPIVAGIRSWVEVESPTNDVAGVNRMMDLASAAAAELGAEVERVPGRSGFGDTVIARIRGRRPGPGILVLAHMDTVHPVGTLARELPFRREADRVYGPGVLDMKGGAYCALHALARVIERDGAPRAHVTMLFTPDEEVGSPSTRELIEATASAHAYVLIPEPAQERGDLITGRWAFQRFVIRAHGRPAHAGARLASGRSAIREMAQQVIAIEALSEAQRNVTLSVGIICGGTFVNVVPATCRAEALAVTPDDETFAAVRNRMLALESGSEDVELGVEPGPFRPLFTPTPETLALYRFARDRAREIGFDPGHGTVGGGSDGNFTGALGIPTLDGLGLCGDGFHTHDEHVLLDSLIPRTQLLSALFRTLGS